MQFLGFNPCFIGNCSHTYYGKIGIKKSFMFQSLFYWKLLSYPRPEGGQRGQPAVSILVLLETALILPHAWRNDRDGANVSILVLLETALIRFELIYLVVIKITVSILVLLETALILKLFKTFRLN